MNAAQDRLPSGREPFRPAWALAGVALLVVCLLLRSWPTLTRPGLFVEDAVLFSHYYGHSRPLSDIFVSHIGQRYLTVVADFFAWAWAWTDVRWQPWFYQWTGFALAVASVATVSFSGLVRNRVLLLVGPLALGLTGLNHLYYANTLIYTMYTGVLMLLALLFDPPPQSVRSFVVQALLLALLPWSGPYSLLALPASLFIFVCTANRTRRVLLTIAILSTLAYFATVSGSTVQLVNLLRPWILVQYLQTVFDKIFFFDFTRHLPMWYGFILLLAIVAVAWLLRRDREYLLQPRSCWGWSSPRSCCSSWASTGPVHHHQRLPPGGGQLLLDAVLVATVDRLLGDRPLPSPWPLVCAALLLTLVVFDNRRHPTKGELPAGSGLAEYLGDIRFYEGQGLAGKKQAVCLHLPRSLPCSPGAGRLPESGARLLLPEDAEIVRGRRFVCRRYPSTRSG